MSYREKIANELAVLSGDRTPEGELAEWEERRLRDNRRDFDKVRAAFKVLADFSNSSGNSEIIRYALIDEMLRTHRFLQAKVLQQLLLGLGDLGLLVKEEPATYADGRNEFEMKLL